MKRMPKRYRTSPRWDEEAGAWWWAGRWHDSFPFDRDEIESAVCDMADKQRDDGPAFTGFWGE